LHVLARSQSFQRAACFWLAFWKSDPSCFSVLCGSIAWLLLFPVLPVSRWHRSLCSCFRLSPIRHPEGIRPGTAPGPFNDPFWRQILSRALALLCTSFFCAVVCHHDVSIGGEPSSSYHLT
jgi:hypothetical protein